MWNLQGGGLLCLQHFILVLQLLYQLQMLFLQTDQLWPWQAVKSAFLISAGLTEAALPDAAV